MKPLFFPFTSLTKYDADSLLNFFETFSYLSTSSEEELAVSEPEWFQTLWREKRAITPVSLSNEELTSLLGAVKSWRAWAEINYGKQTKPGYLKAIFRETPYFTSDSDIFAIRSQIERELSKVEKQIEPDKKAHKKCDYNNSLLFLRLAAISDLENELIDQRLSSIEELQTELFAELKGTLDERVQEDSLNKTLISDRGEFMTEQRLISWFSLFISQKDHFVGSSPYCFVTTSRAIVDFIMSASQKSKLMLDIDNFKVHKEKNSSSPDNNSGAWSEIYKIQWDNDIHNLAKDFLNKGKYNMNITDDELFQFTGQTLTVMLVGLKK